MATLSPIWNSLHYGQDRTPQMFKESSHHRLIRTSLGNTIDSQALGMKIFAPYFMHWADHFAGNPKHFGELVADFERFFFRFRTVCGNSEKKVRDVLIAATSKLEANAAQGDLAISLQSMRDVLADAVTSDAADALFKASFSVKVNYQNVLILYWFGIHN